MAHLFEILYDEIGKTVKRPRRLFRILDKKRFFYYISEIRLRLMGSWDAYENGSVFRKRRYRNYDNYIAHQKSKLSLINLSEYDRDFRETLRKRLENLDFLRRGANVLCLAARIGTEVRSFLDIGCFAVGIDLNPGKQNKYVLHGDFHSIQFPSQSVDVLYINSLDHVLDIEKLINEMKRVLKPTGFLIIEPVIGSEEGHLPGAYESFYWPTIDSLVKLFENAEFTIIKRTQFDEPRRSEQICFKKGHA